MSLTQPPAVVLVVEDEALLRLLVVETLEEAGFEGDRGVHSR